MSEQPVERLGPCQELAGASVLLWPCRPLGLQAWPSCLEGAPGGRAEAAKARPKPQAWHAHTPTNLPKLAECHLLCHPPDGHCMREAHSGAAAECNPTGAKQVPVPTVQRPGLPSPSPWLPPASRVWAVWAPWSRLAAK